MTEQSKKQILNIYQRILAVMADVRYIEKEKKTVNNQYRFVSHDAVTSATSEAFIKHGVYAKPRIIKNEITTIQIEKYNKYEKITLKENSFVCTVEVEYDFINVDNPADKITGINGLGQGIDNQDKACGKAISYACKYALLKALGIETGDDPEKDIDYKITTQSDEIAKVNTITSDQAFAILDLLKEAGVSKELFCNSYKIDTVIQLQIDKYDNAISRLKKKIAGNGVADANN